MKNNNDFTYLREKISEWRDNGWLVPPAVTIRDRFHLWATTAIRPMITQLAHTLSMAGLDTQILDGAEETSPCMGICIHEFNVTLQAWPGADPNFFYLSTHSGSTPLDNVKQEIPYHAILNGGLETILEEAILRCLAPRRATSYRSGMS